MTATNRVGKAWLTDHDMAVRYSVSRATIWRWTRDGKIPKPHRLTKGTTRWNALEVLEFDNART